MKRIVLFVLGVLAVSTSAFAQTTAADTIERALAAAPRDRLTRSAYNLAAFNPSAADVRDVVLAAFPDAAIAYNVDKKRQGIVDSWPAAVDDSAARRDWGFDPTYDFEHAFREYLIPTIRQRYHR